MTEGEDSFMLRTTIRNAVKDWTPIEVSFDEKMEIYSHIPLKVMPLPLCDKNSLFPVDLGEYRWCLQVMRGEGKASMDLGFSVLTLGEPDSPIDINALLLTLTIFHPHHPEMNYITDSLLPFDGKNLQLVIFEHQDVFLDGEESFLDNEGLLKLEIQLQVIRNNVFPPLLSPKFKLEMFWANREIVDPYCSNFVKKTQEEFNKKIKNQSAWSRFCDFLRDGSELASKYQVFSEDQSVIIDKLVKKFYKEDRVWIAPLILDLLHRGYQLSCSDEKLHCVGFNNNKFVLQGDVPDLFVAATHLKYEPFKVREEFELDSLMGDLVLLKNNGYVMFQVFVMGHLFRLCELHFDSYESKTGRNKGMEYKQRVQQEEVKDNAEENEPDHVSESLNDTFIKIKLDDEPDKVSKSLRDKVKEIFRKTMEIHNKAAIGLDEEIAAILKEHEDTPEGLLLTKLISEMYTQGSIDVAALYTNK